MIVEGKRLRIVTSSGWEVVGRVVDVHADRVAITLNNQDSNDRVWEVAYGAMEKLYLAAGTRTARKEGQCMVPFRVSLY